MPGQEKSIMSRLVKVLLVTNALLLIWNVAGSTYAQRPPDYDVDGQGFLKVNINPTNVPPMVNINPNQAVPRVEVTRMPEIRIPGSACDNRSNFQTGIGRTIGGPLMVTYLNIPQQTTVTLSGRGATESINLGSTGQITSAIFLEAGQTLEFNAAVIYSGCRPL
jgi:hypothetical protein